MEELASSPLGGTRCKSPKPRNAGCHVIKYDRKQKVESRKISAPSVDNEVPNNTTHSTYESEIL